MSGWSTKWGLDEMPGRRDSMSKIFHRLRSGSLPGWIGVGPATSATPSPLVSRSHTQPQDSDKALLPVPSLPKNIHTATPTPVKKLPIPIFQKKGEIMKLASASSRESLQQTVSTATSSGSGSSTSTGTWATTGGNTVSTVDARGQSPTSNDEDEIHDFHERLLRNNVKIPASKSLGIGDLYSSPLSIESSPLTPRKQFTIVPCSPQDTLDTELIKNAQRQGNRNLGMIVSALYGKLLVVMGIAFPMAEVISTYIPPSFYDGFYLYLYFGSITFMICVYGNMMRHKATRSVRYTMQRITTMTCRITGHVATDATTRSPEEASTDSEGCASHHQHCTAAHHDDCTKQRIHFGSFYLRMGAVAFGIGSMIYSGLEFGQYFELEPDTKCHNFMIALTPAVRMIFTFMQMYFIFLNSKMAVNKLQIGAQFGLMHMIGTNLCVWLNVLVQETRHEILMFYNPDNGTINYPTPRVHSQPKSHVYGYGHSLYSTTTQTPTMTTTVSPIPTIIQTLMTTMPTTSTTPSTLMTTTSHDLTSQMSPLNSTVASIVTALESHHRVKRGLKGPYSFLECRRSDIMGSLVQNASPFLFPCTIEYSLICAAILYVMWKSMAKVESRKVHLGNCHNGDLSMHGGVKRSPHHYSVDCARANKGLFLGIFVLVLTILSLIIFFVLIPRPGYQALAVLEVNITELILYIMTTIGVLIGMCQMRELRYVRTRNLELDNILLIVAQTGSFIYNVFSIIGGHFTMKMKTNTALVLVTALSSLIQLLFQTLFVLDASKRSATTAEQARRKPGREVVTFLLVTNLAMWAINTLEKSRADSHPVQLKFYGVWAWTIITHISMPLAIFYRFHSTVCLCEIWKRAYKIKPPVYH